MKFSLAAIVGVLATVAFAKPAFTNSAFALTEGTPFNLTWAGATGPVTITLLTGTDANNLKPVKDIGTGLTGSSLLFTPSGLPSGDYAFRITDSTADPNYSVLWQYVGTGTASSSTTTGTSKTSSSTTTGSSATTTGSTSTGTSTTTKSTSTTSSTPTKATSTSTPLNLNEGQRFSSPLALVLITVAALVLLN